MDTSHGHSHAHPLSLDGPDISTDTLFDTDLMYGVIGRYLHPMLP